MSELNSLNPQIGDVERRLAALSPRDARLNVAETLFRAGQESALRRQTRWRLAWPLVTAASVLLSVVTTAAVVRRPEPRFADAERPTAVPEQDAVDATRKPVVPDRQESIRADFDWAVDQVPGKTRELGYLYVRRLALELGVDSLPRGATVAGDGNPPPLRYGDWRRGLADADRPFKESQRGGFEESPSWLSGFSGGSS